MFKALIATLFLVFLNLDYAISQELQVNKSNTTNIKNDLESDEEIELESDEVYDPLEKINRKMFNFNEFIDQYFIEHLARGYRNYVPKPARKSVRNFIDNLALPFTTINSLLQGKMDNSMASFGTFLINTTLGIGGLFDVAKHKGVKYEKEDFGQTFGKYGFKSGPYLFLPFFGPTNLRDLTGISTTLLIDPLGFNISGIGEKEQFLGNNNILISEKVIFTIDVREGLLDTIDNIRQDSFDPYSTIRSAYAQRRNFLIEN